MVTAPAAEPVSLIEVKDRLRVIGDGDDADINRMIAEARSIVENFTRSSLITQTYRATLSTGHQGRRPWQSAIVTTHQELWL